MYETNIEKANIATITGGRYTHKSMLKKKDQRCVDLANQHNAVYNIFRNLWLELGESIRSLIIGNYGSISRSLRWMIESTIFYVDTQNDSPNAVDRFNRYLNNKSGLTLTACHYLLNHISNSNYELLNKRLELKEIGTSTRYKDLVDKLDVFNHNSPNEIKGIPGELNSLYRHFSGLIHISQKSLEEKKKDSEEEYIFFWDSAYDRKKFQDRIEDIWKIVDLITTILLLVCSKFYGYVSVKDFIDTLISFEQDDSFMKKLIDLAKSHKVKRRLTRFLSLTK